MSVYRKKNSPFWQFDFQVEGCRFHGSTKARSRSKAIEVEKAERRAAQRIVADAKASGRRPLTIGEACDRWWTEHGSTLNDSGIKTQVDWLADNIGREVALHDVTDDVVSQLIELRKKDVKPAGREVVDGKTIQLYALISNSTVNNTVPTLLRRIMHRARDNWNAMLLREPNWKKHYLKRKKRPIRELSIAEEQILDDVEDPDFADLRTFAIITGLRRRELIMTWSQVDFEAGVIRVVAKGDQPRIVPLTTQAYALLWQRRGQHKNFVWTFVARRSRRCPHHKTLQKKGERYPITYYGFGNRKARTWKAAGVVARIHDLRHTAGTRALRATGNLKLVQTLLGHSDIKTTAEFYAAVMVDDLRAGMESTAKAGAERAAAVPSAVQHKAEE